MGTGDGRAALRRAAREPGSFVVGLDANADGMIAASRRTAVAGRGALANVAFAVAAVETPPAELVRQAALASVLFPWGSLLRGVLGCDDGALAGLASLLTPGGRIEVLASLAPRDTGSLGVAADRLADRDAIAAAWSCAGLDLLEHRPATSVELASAGSSWAKRLSSSPDRSVIRLAGRRC